MRFRTRIWTLLSLCAAVFILLTYLASRPRPDLIQSHLKVSGGDLIEQQLPQPAGEAPLPQPALQGDGAGRGGGGPLCTRVDAQVLGTKTYYANQLLGQIDRRYYPGIKTFENGVEVPKALEAGKGGKLTVFIVPHSHNDPNWVKSYDGYYQLQTRNILNYAVKYLSQWPDMRFIWTESVFLSTWFGEATEEQRAAFKSLVRQGRLEIAGGGWVSPDEATTHHFGLINQLIDGHLWLQENVGVIPETYWDVDPFGYSLLSPYLLSQAGFKNNVILRVNEHMKDLLRRDRALEFNWQTFWSSQPGSDSRPDSHLLTSLLPFMMYQIKYSCGPSPAICLFFDFRNIDGELSESQGASVDERNINRLSEMLFQQLESKNKFYRHGVVLMPLGDDFRWDREEEWNQQYNNYKKLIARMNQNKAMNVELKFGTLKDYFAAMRSQVQVDSLPRYVGDFYTYTDKEEDYWTGYFTSRPGLKRCSRDVEGLLRAAEIFATAAVANGAVGTDAIDGRLRADVFPMLELARRNLSLFQHHDSITGTSTREVTEDQYLRRILPSAFNNSVSVLAAVLVTSAAGAAVASTPAGRPTFSVEFPSWRSPPGLPELATPPLAQRRLLLLVNSLGQARHDCATIAFQGDEAASAMTKSPSLSIHGADKSANLRCQMEPHFDGIAGGISESVFDLLVCLEMPAYSVTRLALVREASTAPKHGTVPCSTVDVAMNFAHSSAVWQVRRFGNSERSLTLRNSWLSLGFNQATGSFETATVVRTAGGKGRSMGFGLDFGFYTLTKGHRGAYIMNDPVEPDAPLSREGLQDDTVVYEVSGSVRSYIMRQQNRYRSRMALYSTGSVAMDTAARVTNWAQLPSTEASDMRQARELDLELVMRANFSLANGRYFYTDANSAVLVRRHRPLKAPFASGVFPMTGAAVLTDPGQRLRVAVLSGQSHGTALLPDGRLDVMLHRKTSQDDNRGVGQAVQTVYPARSDFLLAWSLPPLDGAAFDAHEPPPAANDERQAGDFLTPSEAALLRRLTYRPLAFLAVDGADSEDFTAPQSLLGELPCTLEIVTYRLLPASHAYHALLVLHNTPASVCSHSSAEQRRPFAICSPPSGPFTLAQLFPGARRPRRIAESTLSGLLVTRAGLDPDEVLPLHGFFIRAFLLGF